ncbi:MAG: hypothetical protein RBS99_08230 [Rhodospirillales bacterium]|jgi:hypothetical protein|nr:hypothetical protein [Rhodospirillales bacterium]
MTLASDRNTPQKGVDHLQPGVATGVKIYAGALVALSATGYATPGATALALTAIGRADETVDNTAGQDGDVTVRVSRGVFRWANSADADEIAAADVGKPCYIVDDETVAKTSGTGTRSPAGLIADVDDLGVWVDTRVAPIALAAGGLAAANNLADVASAAAAFAAIKQNATALATGVVELATPAEVLTGTDEARAVTPKGAADTFATKFGAPTIVVGEEQGGNAINVAIQLTDAAGADLAVRGAILAYLSDDAAGDSIAATAPSSGWAIGTDGLLIPIVAGKAAHLVSEADGDIDVTITEAGAATWYLILVMPDGRLVASEAITFAG